MRGATRQGGITLIGFLMILMVAGFFVFIGMKLVPVYTEYYGVLRALEQIKASPGISAKTPEQIKESLLRNLYIGYVRSVKPANVKVTRTGGSYQVTVAYDVRGNLAYNLDYIATFNKTVDLLRPGVD